MEGRGWGFGVVRIYIILLQATPTTNSKEKKCGFSFLYFDFHIISFLFHFFTGPTSSLLAMASNLALERFIETKEGKIKITFRSRSYVSCILVLSSKETGKT